ncbi:acetyl-CoA acetyltransferase [Allocatelliglobosispora scoriae]|uniref:Acetyl-CoA acetyltransferase n=1 Tax=Allocatelliglobosispora scoriae TaxID=643052 RepID=A0A841C2V1_9ACTN|nr:thiolase [Allocatelliglobosispora scoriae]MBB5873372.1 acetyl-CoA acetyltransferase [Allocatelliglobosispora scoriae]
MSVAIVGAGECDLGVTGLSTQHLLAQAVARALADAGLRLSDVDGIATTGHGRFPATHLADQLGIQPAWTDSTAAGGAVFEMYVARAAQAIAAGQCRVVVIAYASNQRSARSRVIGGVWDPALPEAQFEQPYQPLWPLSYYAMTAQRYLHTYRLDRADLARVAVRAREHALRNPAAFRYGAGPLTVDDVLGAPVVSSPLGTLDCCLVTDGGGAVVLTSLDRARHLRKAPIIVRGYGEAVTHAAMSTADDLLDTGAAVAGKRAFARAGMTPGEIDVVQTYDSFTVSVPLALEQLGLCPPGTGTFWDGVPVNTTGGGLSYCHPGQLGVLLLVEAVRQLRGECGERQVPGAASALVHGIGGISSSHAAVILEAG